MSSENQHHHDNQFVTKEAVKGEGVADASPRKSTGPRSLQGKERSKLNATKHGICSSEALLKNESPAEHKSFVKALQKDFQPQGTLLEEIFMEIAANRWNKRRLHKSRNAAIAERIEFSEIDRSIAQEAQAWDSEQLGGTLGGMLKPGGNYLMLRNCVEILKQIRFSVEAYGFPVENAGRLLGKCYGSDIDGLGIPHLYFLMAAQYASVTEEGKSNGDHEKIKKHMVRALDEEIGRLTTVGNALLEMGRARSKYRDAEALVAGLELYKRYEIYLDRQFDKLLNRYERVQRMQSSQQGLH